jgi:hypothetical protein
MALDCNIIAYLSEKLRDSVKWYRYLVVGVALYVNCEFDAFAACAFHLFICVKGV